MYLRYEGLLPKRDSDGPFARSKGFVFAAVYTGASSMPVY